MSEISPRKKLTAIPKPWEALDHPAYPQRGQVLVITFLISLWLHILFFGSWQVSSWRLGIMDGPAFESPIMELTISVIPEDASPALAALEPRTEPAALRELPPLHEDLNQTTAQVAALSEEALKNLAAAPLIDKTPLAAAGGVDESMNMLDEPPPEMKKYSTATTSKIRQKWVTPPNAYEGGVYVAEITIDKKGTLTRIITTRSSGDPILDHAAMEAIKAASPFDRFPASMAGLDQYSYEVVFNYQVKKVPARTAKAKTAKSKNSLKKQRR